MKWLKIPLYALAAAAVFFFAACITINVLLTDQSTIACPDLTGLDVQEARQLAEQKGLSLVTGKYERRDDVPYNRVILQTPVAAMPVRAGRIVTVVVSDGPVPVIIPSFLGLSLEEAKNALADRGMALKKVVYVPSAHRNRVLAQMPGSGENILDREGMMLFVGAQEKPFYVMPDIAAGDCNAVLQEIEEKHIKYILMSASSGQPDMSAGRALRCNVPAGTIFTEDDVLELQIPSGG